MGSEVPDIWISRFATQHQKNAVFSYLRGRYSTSELRELDDYAWSYGIELIPCIQTLAHLEDAFRWPCFDEIKDCDNILLCGDEKTYTFIEAMCRRRLLTPPAAFFPYSLKSYLSIHSALFFS